MSWAKEERDVHKKAAMWRWKQRLEFYSCKSRNAKNQKPEKLESSKEEFYPEPHREHGPGDILILNF